MNRMMIIGNLTRNPELRSTSDGTSVCSFAVAVNKPKKDWKDQEADFFNVSAWRQLGENCAKYLAKGRKVCVIGPLSAELFTRNDGSTGVSLKIEAKEVEFLSSRSDGDQNYDNGNPAPAAVSAPAAATNVPEGFTAVESTDDLPF